MATRKKATGGAKTRRTETLTVRLDPKLRYLSEIAGRVQRRTLSSFAEWAIEDSLSRVVIEEHGGDFDITVADMSARLWDVEEADRFAKLAFGAPQLLNYDEQRIWKVVQECGALWRGHWEVTATQDGKRERFNWEVHEDNFMYQRLRKHWDAIRQVALGEAPASTLPQWERERERKAGDDDPFSDIPF